ncbi:hypothetical protein EV360DRAFT_76386 [Lentinula raphanica]|nr:hypothetical protein EV360DRAFT_76386 [Lentinula raphanica]
MLHSLLPCGSPIRLLSILLLFSTSCRVIAAPVGGPSQSVETPEPPIWDNQRSRYYNIYFRRAQYEGFAIPKSVNHHKFNEVAKISIGTAAGTLMPAYDENAKDWFVKWEPAQRRLQVQSCHRLGKIWVAVHMSQDLITKLQGLQHAADPIEATNEALSVLKATQFFEGDEVGNLAYEKWYRKMSEMKEQGETKWIVPKEQHGSVGPGSVRGSSSPGPVRGSSSPGPVRGSSSPAFTPDSSSPAFTRTRDASSLASTRESSSAAFTRDSFSPAFTRDSSSLGPVQGSPKSPGSERKPIDFDEYLKFPDE